MRQIVNYKADGKHNLRTLTQILLLSKVELFSSDNENIILPSQRLFALFTRDGADTTQALRDFILWTHRKMKHQKN